MVNIFWFLRGTNEVMAREVFGYDDVILTASFFTYNIDNDLIK